MADNGEGSSVKAVWQGGERNVQGLKMGDLSAESGAAGGEYERGVHLAMSLVDVYNSPSNHLKCTCV